MCVATRADEIEAQRAAEEQARQEKKAQRKAKQQAEAPNSVNPWVVDGEDLTRKSACLSYVASAAPASNGSSSSGGGGGGGNRQVDQRYGDTCVSLTADVSTTEYICVLTNKMKASWMVWQVCVMIVA